MRPRFFRRGNTPRCDGVNSILSTTLYMAFQIKKQLLKSFFGQNQKKIKVNCHVARRTGLGLFSHSYFEHTSRVMPCLWHKKRHASAAQPRHIHLRARAGIRLTSLHLDHCKKIRYSIVKVQFKQSTRLAAEARAQVQPQQCVVHRCHLSAPAEKSTLGQDHV